MSILSSISVAAPAKINLYLHITGKRDDGYHTLGSLVAFAEIGDRIDISEHETLTLHIDGAFADRFSGAEKSTEPDSANIVIKATRGLSTLLGIEPNFKINLHKTLPLAAGIGGGSADAAATVKAILQFHDIDPASVKELDAFLLSLGADVPVCFYGQPCHMSGIGEIIRPAAGVPPLHMVLVNPLEACSTAEIFRQLNGKFTPDDDYAAAWDDARSFISFLQSRGNDMEDAAVSVTPVIADILCDIAASANCLLSRMSGSGATCFGLYETAADATAAAAQIQSTHPQFWVRKTTLLT